MNPPKKSLLRTIQDGIAEAPVDFASLQRPSGGPVRKTDHPVGKLSGELMKLHHFFVTKVDAHNALVVSMNKEQERLIGNIKASNPFTALLALLRPKGALHRLAEIEETVSASDDEVSDIRDFLKMEIKRAFPEVAGKPVFSVRSDWSVVWSNRDDTELDLEDAFEHLSKDGARNTRFGEDDIVIEGGENLPHEIREHVLRTVRELGAKHGGDVKVRVTRIDPSSLFGGGDEAWVERMRQRINA